MMDSIALLAELRAMVDSPPRIDIRTPLSRDQMAWLGRAHALVSAWNSVEAASISVSADFIAAGLYPEGNLRKILTVIHRVIAALELQVPTRSDQAFGPGAVYDFLKTLRDLLSTAKQNILIVDPYLDEQIFDTYLSTIDSQVTVRLLADKYATSLKPTHDKFISQKKMSVEIRISRSIHDRIVFLDNNSCWVLGQSIKDAAVSKPTYMAPLSGDIAKQKLIVYEEIWNTSLKL
jgi:hypothetical protein